MPRIAVIIVNFETAALACDAVESLRQQPSGCDLDIHLVDNASSEADQTRLRETAERLDWDERVQFHWNEVNLGFGRANNVVLSELASSSEKPEYVLFLNPDARANNDIVSILSAFLGLNQRVAFVGPKIRLIETGELRHAAFRFPGLLTTFLRAAGHPALYRNFPKWRLGLDSSGDPVPADWVTGACCMARFEALEETGFFETAFFLYWEEVELMRRAARLGWECWHVPRAEALHQEGASTGVSGRKIPPDRLPPYWYESWAIYFRKTHGRAYAFLAAVLWLLGSAINCLLVVTRQARRTAPQRFLSDFWRHSLRPLLGISARVG